MDKNAFLAWLIAGISMVLAEFLLPGLVSVFLGLGALSVAALVFLGVLDSIPTQIISWMGFSMAYIFTLRIAVMRLYPTDTTKQSIDEDWNAFGDEATVMEPADSDGPARISHGGTTWLARSDTDLLVKGDKVRLLARDNITWLVEVVHDDDDDDLYDLDTV